MDNPESEICAVVRGLTATDSPDVQKATLERYMTPDVGFRHPVCRVKPGRNSRKRVLGIYQWYRVLSPHIDLQIKHVVFNRTKDVVYLEIVQVFKLFFLPRFLPPTPARLITRLRLVKIDELHYIEEQEDFYHPDDFAALLFPISARFVRASLFIASFLSDILAKGASLLGYWKTCDPTKPPPDGSEPLDQSTAFVKATQMDLEEYGLYDE